ncbi:DNA repair protein RecO [Chromatiaceae bacterium AAb-1]|nr:DNA repair protein RecO [Chromatiaceae bacterium AAb-1]
MQYELLPAYILHSRPFQEDKLLLQLLLPELGRLSAVIRKRQGKQRYALQPFQLFGVVLSGRTELKTIRTLDELAPACIFSGKVLFSALYVNELICRIWPDNQAAEQLFQVYRHTLQQLNEVEQQQNGLLEPCLRQFEFSLLQELGLQVDWQQDATGNLLQPQYYYQWQDGEGFVRAASGWTGQQLLSIGQQQWQQQGVSLAAKQLSRKLLAPLLGDKPLLSRSLFSQT